MGIFDVFKKDKGPDYDPTNIKITDVRPGFILEYDLKTWEVAPETRALADFCIVLFNSNEFIYVY